MNFFLRLKNTFFQFRESQPDFPLINENIKLCMNFMIWRILKDYICTFKIQIQGWETNIISN